MNGQRRSDQKGRHGGVIAHMPSCALVGVSEQGAAFAAEAGTADPRRARLAGPAVQPDARARRGVVRSGHPPSRSDGARQIVPATAHEVALDPRSSVSSAAAIWSRTRRAARARPARSHSARLTRRRVPDGLTTCQRWRPSRSRRIRNRQAIMPRLARFGSGRGRPNHPDAPSQCSVRASGCPLGRACGWRRRRGGCRPVCGRART
jgi:hypothetical protein